MDNLSKAVYMSAFALLFVFAASVSIYLYATLDNYLEEGVNSAKIVNRAESSTEENLSNYKRDIDINEIYLVAHNMKQMHVDILKFGTYTLSVNADEEEKKKFFNDIYGEYYFNYDGGRINYSSYIDSSGKTIVSYNF